MRSVAISIPTAVSAQKAALSGGTGGTEPTFYSPQATAREVATRRSLLTTRESPRGAAKNPVQPKPNK